MERAQKVAPIASLQPQYSLLARDVEDSVLPYALNQKIGVIVYSPMASGMLTGAMTRERIASMPKDDWRKDARISRSRYSPVICGWSGRFALPATVITQHLVRLPLPGPWEIERGLTARAA
jgi:hypothetical protein